MYLSRVEKDEKTPDYGGADWFYLSVKNPSQITDPLKVKKYKVQGFSL